MRRPIASCGSTAGRGIPVRAFVHFGAGEVAYTRSGRGSPVLVIAADRRLRAALQTLLDRAFLVIAPDIDGRWDNRAHAQWLPAFIDSLGIRQPHLVACGRAAGGIRHEALNEAERIGRRVLIAGPSLPRGSGRRRRARPGSFPAQTLLELRLSGRRVLSADERSRLLEFLGA